MSEWDINDKPSPQMQAVIERTIAKMKAAFRKDQKFRARLRRLQS